MTLLTAVTAYHYNDVIVWIIFMNIISHFLKNCFTILVNFFLGYIIIVEKLKAIDDHTINPN